MKKRYVLGTVFAVVGAVIYAINKKSGGEPEKYSYDWIKSLSNTVWEKEREKLNLRYCHSGDNYEEAVRLEKLISLFDKVKSDRDWGNELYGYPKHSENGWYLLSD